MRRVNLTVVISTFFVVAASGLAHASAESNERAAFKLGDAAYDLDFVLCYQEPDGSTRIYLGDKAARPDFPSIGIWLMKSQSADAAPQVFSADFYRAFPRLKWRFENGEHEMSKTGFMASGVMNGTVLDENAERFMTPLGEDENQSFLLEVTCNDF